MPHRSDCLTKFLQPKLQARFYRPQWSMGLCGNFAVSESLEKCELDCFTLEPWQHSYGLFEKMMQVAQNKRIICLATAVARLFPQLFSITITCARIGLASAQSIDGATTPDRYHPTEGLACWR